MGVDIWTDTVVIKHAGKLYPFGRLADSNLFEESYNGTLRRVQNWVGISDHNPERNLWGLPEDLDLKRVKEIAKNFFLGLLPVDVIREGKVDKAEKEFGFYSGLYYNVLGPSGNVSLTKYINRMVRAFERAVTVEQLVCVGHVDCNEQDRKLIKKVEHDLDMLPTFEFLRTNEEARRGVYHFLNVISNKAALWRNTGKVESLIYRNFFKEKEEKKSPAKYGVEVARYLDSDGNPIFNEYVSRRTRNKIFLSLSETYPYRSIASATRVVTEVNLGKYPDIVAARVIVQGE